MCMCRLRMYKALIPVCRDGKNDQHAPKGLKKRIDEVKKQSSAEMEKLENGYKEALTNFKKAENEIKRRK